MIIVSKPVLPKLLIGPLDRIKMSVHFLNFRRYRSQLHNVNVGHLVRYGCSGKVNYAREPLSSTFKQRSCSHKSCMSTDMPKPGNLTGQWKTSDRIASPIKKYSELLGRRILEPDQVQFTAVKRLQEVYNRLKDYDPGTSVFVPQFLGSNGLPLFLDPADESTKEKLKKRKTKKEVPKGFYIHGGVGSGKTLLLDLFYDSIPTNQKKRVHFNAFMLYLYSEINRWNLCSDSVDEVSDFLTPTEAIARRILQDAWLICFDEIQLSDYGTCSLLSAIFRHMVDHGAVIVATSNRPPEQLGDSSLTEMHDGEVGEVVTESIASFKLLLKEQCEIFHLDSLIDYRNQMKKGEQTYFYPIEPKNEETLDKAFVNCVGAGESLGSAKLEVYGREILIPIATRNGVARFTFKELFTTPKGPADYIQICNNYHTVFVENVPKLNMSMKNEARRFLSFVDAAYESRTKVYCTAEAPPEDLFTLLPKGENDVSDPMHLEMIGEIAYDLRLQAIDFGALGFITGEDEIFSFKRAISRLQEMQGYLYQMSAHRPQHFAPYRGSQEERKDAEKNRLIRERRRRQKMKEMEAAQATEKERRFEALETGREISSETDWGDEASYVAWSQDIVRKQKEDQRRQDLDKRQANAPKFSEQHFWGFGWWENAIGKLKRRPSNTSSIDSSEKD